MLLGPHPDAGERGPEARAKALNGRAGIDAAATLQPDVIVLNVSMPGMNGFEVASSLREAGSTAALIFFTVHQEQDVVTAALAAGGSVTSRSSVCPRPRARRPRSSRRASIRLTCRLNRPAVPTWTHPAIQARS